MYDTCLLAMATETRSLVELDQYIIPFLYSSTACRVVRLLPDIASESRHPLDHVDRATTRNPKLDHHKGQHLVSLRQANREGRFQSQCLVFYSFPLVKGWALHFLGRNGREGEMFTHQFRFLESQTLPDRLEQSIFVASRRQFFVPWAFMFHGMK